eukprot:1190260-Prorocentrum_minimum.AAC.1
MKELHESQVSMGAVCGREADAKNSSSTTAGAETSFCFIDNFLPERTRLKLLEEVSLGRDPSSTHFAERFKAIRFVKVEGGRIQCLDQDYFVQNADYNDFSGGFKRYYDLIPEHVFSDHLRDAVLGFMRLYDLPDGVILAQIQRSVFSPQKPGLTRQQSTTGQGIHTDGLNHAMIVNLQRGRHIRGALNQFHGKLDGTEPLCEPTVLGEGVACAFKDNTIFHYVTPGYVSEDGGAVEDRSRVAPGRAKCNSETGRRRQVALKRRQPAIDGCQQAGRRGFSQCSRTITPRICVELANASSRHKSLATESTSSMVARVGR